MSEKSIITRGIILAAGLGTRMRPLTNDCPKPLIKLNGKAMLDRAIDALRAVGVTDIVVNTHYMADKISEHLKGQKGITIIYEPEILETGGGVRNALPNFKGEPFYVLTSDIMWVDGNENALMRLARYWDVKTMDLLLLVNKKLPESKGDFVLEGDFGKPVHRDYTSETPNVTYMGVSIINPAFVEGFAEGFRPFREFMFKAQENKRLSALVHDGERFSVGTPEAFEKFNKLFVERNI